MSCPGRIPSGRNRWPSASETTALGIKRSEKAPGYIAQHVNAEDINVGKDVRLMNSPDGKIAGAVIDSSASGIGGAMRVVLRGLKSGGSSNALYVADGVPLTVLAGFSAAALLVRAPPMA